jgi:hypothetical protein
MVYVSVCNRYFSEQPNLTFPLSCIGGAACVPFTAAVNIKRLIGGTTSKICKLSAEEREQNDMQKYFGPFPKDYQQADDPGLFLPK